jgi:fumarate hydratase subunit beta
MIGKGARNSAVARAMRQAGSVYFGALGGAGALLAERVVSAEVIAFEDLGAEAVRRLEVLDFPVVVVIDADGGDLYDVGRTEYLQTGV